MAEQTVIYHDDGRGNPDVTNPCFKLMCSYDKTTGQLIFYSWCNPNRNAPQPNQMIIYTDCKFCFLFDTPIEKSGLVDLFNQKPDSEKINEICKDMWDWDEDDLNSYAPSETTLENVWNRDQLYLHASFSNSKRHYLCFSNEVWERPSKIYFDNTYGSEFSVYYTTDGIHRLDPLYAHKLIELSFVLRTSTL